MRISTLGLVIVIFVLVLFSHACSMFSGYGGYRGAYYHPYYYHPMYIPFGDIFFGAIFILLLVLALRRRR